MPGIHLHVHADNLSGSGCPADVEGLGPVTGRLGRDLAAQATTRHLVEHDAARDTEPGYRPSAGLSEHVVDRDGTCVFPGCPRPARTGDVDHTIPWPAGPTSAANLGALCRRHHRLKQSPGVALVQPRPGRFRWRLPTGHAHETEPPDP
jgi:hypothetical protein